MPLVALILLLLIGGCSWAVVSGFLWLIAWCFGMSFNLKIATGIWLIIMLIRYVFFSDKKEKKK